LPDEALAQRQQTRDQGRCGRHSLAGRQRSSDVMRPVCLLLFSHTFISVEAQLTLAADASSGATWTTIRVATRETGAENGQHTLGFLVDPQSGQGSFSFH
jgi:hypothetical protein